MSGTRDLSNFGGVPVYLYQFSRSSKLTLTGATVTRFWSYTSADRDYVFGGDTYKAIPLKDDGIRQSGDATADQLTITMSFREEIPQLFAGSPPSDPIQCQIILTHAGEGDGFPVWSGIIAAVGIAGDGLTASIICNTLSATLERAGNRLVWGRQCTHTLYDQACRVDPRSFHVAGVLTAVDGVNVAANEFQTISNTPTPGTLGDHILAGGFIEWIDDHGQAERRGILQHTPSGVLRLLGGADRCIVGLHVNAFFGCDHTHGMCDTIFRNLDNHGGHVYMPDINPFSGDPVF